MSSELFLTCKHMERELKEWTPATKPLEKGIKKTFRSLNRLSGFLKQSLMSPPHNSNCHWDILKNEAAVMVFWVLCELQRCDTWKPLHCCSCAILTFCLIFFKALNQQQNLQPREAKQRVLCGSCYSSQNKNYRREQGLFREHPTAQKTLIHGKVPVPSFSKQVLPDTQ